MNPLKTLLFFHSVHHCLFDVLINISTSINKKEGENEVMAFSYLFKITFLQSSFIGLK
jgi:hypothetical protein